MQEKQDSTYVLIHPDGTQITLEALPETRHEAISQAAALAGSSPLPGVYRLVLQFTDPEYGFSEVKQISLNYYSGQGWGIGATKMPSVVPLIEEDMQCFGRHLRTVCGERSVRKALKITRASEHSLCLYVPGAQASEGGEARHEPVLMIRMIGLGPQLPWAASRAELGFGLQADAPTLDTTLMMAEEIAAGFSGTRELAVRTLPDDDAMFEPRLATLLKRFKEQDF